MAQSPTSWLSVVEVHVTVADGALLAIVVHVHFSKSMSINVGFWLEPIYVFGVFSIFVSPGLQTVNLRLGDHELMFLPVGAVFDFMTLVLPLNVTAAPISKYIAPPASYNEKKEGKEETKKIFQRRKND